MMRAMGKIHIQTLIVSLLEMSITLKMNALNLVPSTQEVTIISAEGTAKIMVEVNSNLKGIMEIIKEEVTIEEIVMNRIILKNNSLAEMRAMNSSFSTKEAEMSKNLVV